MRQREAERLVRRYQRALNVEDWRIKVVLIRHKALRMAIPEAGDVHGYCVRDTDARRATVYLVTDRRKAFADRQEIEVSDAAVLAHEVAHVAFALGEERMCEIVAQILAP